jgi:hypothetical protein
MRVRVTCPAKSAAQSGNALSRFWIVEPENETPRIPEPIMGWIGAADTYSGLKGVLRFPSEKDAMAFVKSNRWEFIVTEPPERREEPRNYLQNFRIVRPEDEEKDLHTE